MKTLPWIAALAGAAPNREVRRWYARDRGRTTLEEIVAMFGESHAVSRTA